ncbi:hypothetical protein ES319_A11G212500v1 [Gossypium barbadense]|uniref:Uncharacterized protein n=2 Tax=Gossypium TaxID=3633 RepID=A0A5J5TRE1_GOSBA|nr:hypothetical protein ES319_A11G212500v1 [Gossypium barbadense]TYG94951.1 hypothetical protein ES288_A11G229000v1 [Gossypium darwinii]
MKKKTNSLHPLIVRFRCRRRTSDDETAGWLKAWRRWWLAREKARRCTWWPMVGQKFGSSMLGG